MTTNKEHTLSINVYPNKMDNSQVEVCTAYAGQTIEQWLIANVPSYYPSSTPPISCCVNNQILKPDDWDKYVLNISDCVDITVEAKEAVTIFYAIVAVAAVGSAIYARNQIPDNYNNTTPQGSSIYEANAQGNKPKLMGVIPELAGTHKQFPDHLSMPHQYFSDNDEFINIMMCITVGECSVLPSQIFIGSTRIDRYAGDIQYTIFPPGASVETHPAHKNIYTSNEIDGQGFELTTHDSSFSTGLSLDESRDYVRTNGDTFSCLLGNEYQTYEDWQPGDTLQFDGTANSSVVFENVIDIVNSIFTHTAGDFGVLSIDQRVVLVGAGAADGDYLVQSVSDTTLTLKHLNGASATFDDSYDKRIQIMTYNWFFGLYEVVTNNSNQGWKVKRVNDPDWIEFPTEYSKWLRTSVKKINGEVKNYEVGPFSATPESEQTKVISLDFKLNGLGKINDNGSIDSLTIDIIIWYRKFEESWRSYPYSISAATMDDIGETINIDVESGSYEVKVIRVSNQSDDVSVRDKIYWKRLKAELPTVTRYEGVTTMAVTMRGTNALSNSASQKLSVVATRVLPVFENGQWSAPKPTNDIAPFFCYAIKDCGHSDDQIGLAETEALHTLWRNRGDEFNGVFDSESTLFPSLQRILLPGFAEPTLDYGQIIPVRDGPRTIYDYMYQPDNIKSPGLKRSIKLIGSDEPDGVEVEYFNNETWKPETILCLLPEDTGINPISIRAYGVTNRTLAWRFGMRKRREIRYRRTQYSFQTEMDALNSKYLSYDALADDVPGYSQSGRLHSATGLSLTVEHELTWSEGTHYIALRKPNGCLSGPYIATPTSDPYIVNIDSELDFVPSFNDRQEPPLYMFGTAKRWCYPVLIKNIQPKGTETVSVTAENYDERVYEDDDNDPDN